MIVNKLNSSYPTVQPLADQYLSTSCLFHPFLTTEGNTGLNNLEEVLLWGQEAVPENSNISKLELPSA
jgi:hypothetical protein